MFIYGSGYLNRTSATFSIFSNYQFITERNEVSEMIESKQEVSKDLEKALQALEQAKQRVYNETKILPAFVYLLVLAFIIIYAWRSVRI